MNTKTIAHAIYLICTPYYEAKGLVVPEWGAVPMHDACLEHRIQRYAAGMTIPQAHAQWVQELKHRGWKLGPVRSYEKREHPHCKPFSMLGTTERTGIVLFHVCWSLMNIFGSRKTDQAQTNKFILVHVISVIRELDPNVVTDDLMDKTNKAIGNAYNLIKDLYDPADLPNEGKEVIGG